MTAFILDFAAFFVGLAAEAFEQGLALPMALKLFPFLLLLELPFTLIIMAGIARHYFRNRRRKPSEGAPFHPAVSCIITCYSEGRDVAKTLYTLAYQTYDGPIEVIPVVDGASVNKATYEAVMAMMPEYEKLRNRSLFPVAKKMRGGRVSSLNAGLSLAHGQVVMALDGDTSFDNDMIAMVVRHFRDPNVVAVSGNIRVRNWRKGLATRLQALEYSLGLSAGRLGLGEFGVINNISGAFGAFRRSLLERIGGWDTGTAEDLDITTRIKGYFGRHPNLKIVFEPHAVAHTDGPETFKGLIKQRERWDGDLAYIYIRKFWRSFSPSILGWRNFILYVVLGLFFQLVVPFVIVLYHLYLFAAYPPGYVAAIMTLIYGIYFTMTLVLFVQYIWMVSRDRAKDIWLGLWIPLFPFYNMMLRFLIVSFILKEMLFKAHLDSSMAPWWVLRRGKF